MSEGQTTVVKWKRRLAVISQSLWIDSVIYCIDYKSLLDQYEIFWNLRYKTNCATDDYKSHKQAKQTVLYFSPVKLLPVYFWFVKFHSWFADFRVHVFNKNSHFCYTRLCFSIKCYGSKIGQCLVMQQKGIFCDSILSAGSAASVVVPWKNRD